MLTESTIMQALQGVMDPEIHRSLVDLGMIRQVQIDGGRVTIVLALTTLGCPLRGQIADDVKKTVGALDGVTEVQVELSEMTADEKGRIGMGAPAPEMGQVEALNDIRRVVAVMSGKGGVGKSLVSGLLAVALRRQGLKVGILDADITGPSIPKMFFPDGAQLSTGPVGPMPPESQGGVKVVSINLLLEQEDQAVIWRGPMISAAIKQFWGDIFWGTLDYLIVDLPPGTSDASLTVMQSLPLSGVVLVTSPQDLAGMVVRKAARMASMMQTPILGLIENMSYFESPDTGKRYDIFGPSHAEEMAAWMNVPFLGRLPIDPQIARLADAGRIEEYAAEPFTPIAQALIGHVPEARRKA
jgi:ATP-binding protein involved in chromosome partitioning